MNENLKAYTDKMEKSISVYEKDLAGIRAGRANPAILDKVSVEYYGTPTPVAQVGSVSVTDARTIVIQPWDMTVLPEIEKAIIKSDIGINPNNDGKVIRLNFPPLTEERRKELVKEINKRAEEARVAIRAIRRDANEAFKKAQKGGEITEDDLKGIEKDVQKETDSHIKTIDDTIAKKEKEIMEI